MARIFRATRFSTVLIFVLCILPSVLVSKDVSPSIIRLPSEVAGEGQNVCAVVAAASACPVKCFRTDPVCGVDGVTYWCGCAEAACAGAKVAKMGFCEVGNGGSASDPLSAQAFLLVHIVWLILLAFSVLFGLF